MTQVLDAHAVITYLEKERGYEKVTNALTRASETNVKLLMTTINWGEVYYTTLREKGTEVADQILQVIDSFPIEVVDVDKALAKQAGLYKAQKKMSYADCFSAALAKLNKAELITGDKEFKAVQDEIKILWLR